MIGEKPETRLAMTYEQLRRREYELITELLDLLPKIDGLDEEQIAQVRDALFHADHPYLMVFVGPFSSGKSSVINALLGDKDLLPVGPTPTTDRITMLRWGETEQRVRTGDMDTVFHPSPLLQKVSFVDTPGLESIFQKHEEITRKFLHRSDAVLLVMLVTQAMTARNLEYLKMLHEYDKTVIIVLNQTDLLTPEEVEAVKTYVLDQSQALVGYRPPIWTISARRGIEALREDGTLDETLWEQSGLEQIESFVDEQLHDVARLRQKLQTPLQIVQRVHHEALRLVRDNQSALDQYAGIAQNVQQQLVAYQREQERTLREIAAEVEVKFAQTGERGAAAIREMFKLSNALRIVLRGFAELIGIAGLLRRGRASLYARSAFEAHEVLQPIDELPDVTGKLGPRLEGKDIQDVDDLVKYAQREIAALPPAIQGKVIGRVQAPLQYDRSALQKVRPQLEAIAEEARAVEIGRIESAVRNTLLYIGFWEALIIALIAFVIAANPATLEQPLLTVGLVVLLVILGGLGMLLLPVRGRILAAAFANRMTKLGSRYSEEMRRAASEQIEYGMRLRRDAVSPLTRLIEAQMQTQSEQLAGLQAVQTALIRIESELSKLRT